NAVSDSLKRMESVDISSGIVKQFENLDNKIKKTAMKLTQKLSLKKLIPYVRKLLTNPDLELKMLAGDFILDNDSVDDIELLLDYFKEIDEYLLEKAKKIKPKKNTFNENVGNNEKRAFYFANTMDNFFDEEELIASSIEAFKSSSKFVKATCVLKLIDCVDPKGMALINNALDDHDTYLVDAAINAISKRKSNDMDYLLVKKLNNVSKYNIVNLLNGIWTKKITVEGNLLNKFSKTKDQYVKLLVSNIRKLKT
ncbi:hypothetical protein KAJ27_23060, partial [bacterium]|nr:hypothetical protein [bacterium]